MDRHYSIENARARQQIESLVSSLDDRGLDRRLANGWTVAQTLVHLAFWDLRQLALLKRWRRAGIDSSSVDVEIINEAVLGISAAVPLEVAGRLAVASAMAIDEEADRVSDDLRAAIVASGQERVLMRSLHRQEHLNQIEKTTRVGHVVQTSLQAKGT
jgi:hypothetical protein